MARDLEKRKEYHKQYRLENKEKIKQYRLENKEYHKQYRLENKQYDKQYRLENKEKMKEYNKQYGLENKEKIKQYDKQYRLNNNEKHKEYKKNYIKKRCLIDPLYKLTKLTRSLITTSIKSKGYTKKSRAYTILGCSFESFKTHLEQQFTEGMSWDNQGKWHLDHIYPVSLAKDEEHIIKLNHYTNFQPLWAIDNLIKGNKII